MLKFDGSEKNLYTFVRKTKSRTSGKKHTHEQKKMKIFKMGSICNVRGILEKYISFETNFVELYTHRVNNNKAKLRFVKKQ